MVKHTLLNQWGELSPHGVAMCVEKMLAKKTHELPQWILKHIDQSAKCRNKIAFLLEYEIEKVIKQTMRTNINAKTLLTSHEKRDTTSCNATLQVIAPIKNDVQIGEIYFEFEHPLKSTTQLYIIDDADKRILEIKLKQGSTEYSFIPKNAKTGKYYYIISTTTTSVASHFYYCSNEDKNSIIIKGDSASILL